MELRVEEIAEVTKLLPPPSPAVRKAIDQGAAEVKAAASQALVAKTKASSLSRFRLSKFDDFHVEVKLSR